MTRKGLTLIELLIVVAIIAVLAAAAVPNLLEAQIRAKATRAVADIRAVATGLEAYCVDHGAYPMCNNEMLDGWRPGSDAGTQARYLELLSTPVAYLSRPLLRDPFKPFGRHSDFSPADHQGTFTDQTADPDRERIGDYKYGAIKADAGNGGGFANLGAGTPGGMDRLLRGSRPGLCRPARADGVARSAHSQRAVLRPDQRHGVLWRHLARGGTGAGRRQRVGRGVFRPVGGAPALTASRAQNRALRGPGCAFSGTNPHQASVRTSPSQSSASSIERKTRTSLVLRGSSSRYAWYILPRP